MPDWEGDLAQLTDEFAGVVSVSTGDDVDFGRAYGLADRAHRTPVSIYTGFGIASATKGFTAVTVADLIVDGSVRLDTTARSILGADLPLISDEVTVEHPLTHRSGIGDYMDEDLPEPLPPKVRVQDLETTEPCLPALDGLPAKFPAGTRFSYCNSGYVVLALLAERIHGGTQMIDRLLARLLRSRCASGTPVSVTPEADTAPSRRVPGKNRFSLVDAFQSRHIPGRPAEGPTARYRRTL